MADEGSQNHPQSIENKIFKDRFKISRPNVDVFPLSSIGKIHPIQQQSQSMHPPRPSQSPPASRHHSVITGISEVGASSKNPKIGRRATEVIQSKLGVSGRLKNVLKRKVHKSLKSFPEMDDDQEDVESNLRGLRSWQKRHSIEHPPNIDFYRNTVSLEGQGTRPSMLDLIGGIAQESTVSPDYLKSVKQFQERNIQILSSQQLISKGSWRKSTSSVNDNRLKAINKNKKDSKSVDAASSAADRPSVTPSTAGPSDKFGWIEGVLIRCMASIFGVMLYLRISWVAGQAGILLGSCVVLLGTLITVVTALSTSAICTNGMVKGGGAYYLISRSLGPDFGGSIGVIFSLANAVGAAMYIVGFAETIRDLLKKYGLQILDGDLTDIRIIGFVACICVVGIIIVGMSFESKMQIILMFILLASILDYFVGTFFNPTLQQQVRGVTGYKLETLKENMMPAFRDGYNFFTVFSVYFPAATGIMAGANISGDLKDPQRAIPLGTLLAIVITSCVYLAMIWLTGATVVRDADGINLPQLLTHLNVSDVFDSRTSGDYLPVADDEQFSSYFMYYAQPDCVSNSSCPYGLMNYFQVVELGSALGSLVTAGIIASTLSSALVSMVGAPKVFQAVCRDKLFPYINRFGKGHGPNGEPRQALFLGCAIAFAIIMIGDLNAIAPIISNFFLCSYALINYACFDNSFAHSPGFRPSFKFYNMWVSLAGSFMCIFVMFVISWSTALLTFFFFTFIFMYLAHRKPDVNWGSSTQAHSYRNALQYVTKLERTDEHVKNYRPQILVMSGNPAARAGLVDFAYSITKGNSLMLCGHIIPYECTNSVFKLIEDMNERLRMWFKNRHMKAFPVTVANKNMRSGGQILLQVAGLGKLKPNIVIMGFKHNWIRMMHKDSIKGLEEINEYFGLIQDAFAHNISVAVLRNGLTGLDLTEFILATNQQRNSSDNYLTVPGEDGHSTTITSGNASSIQTQANEYISRSTPGQKARQMFLNTFAGGKGGGGAIDVNACNITSNFTDPNSTVTSTNTCFTNLDSELGIAASLAAANQAKEAGSVEEYPMDAAKYRKTCHRPSSILSQITLPSDVNRFQNRVKSGVIDVWWLYDDGGLTLLVPYLLAQPKSYLENAKLRVFTLSHKGKKLEQEQKSMATLLSKFRINFVQANVIPDSSNRPTPESLAKFDLLVEPFLHRPEHNHLSNEEKVPEGMITLSELKAHEEKTYRALRLSEMLRKHSSTADLIVVTLPVPRRGVVSSALYMTWLEVISRDLPPTLMIRGNQQSVLTFYS